MNRDDYFNNDNYPPGFEDQGIVYRGNYGREFINAEKTYAWASYYDPTICRTPEEGDAMRNKLNNEWHEQRKQDLISGNSERV